MARKKRLDLKATLMILAIVILLSGSLYLLLYKKQCLNQNCFIDSLWKCNKVIFTNAQENSTWSYAINGLKGDNCEVNVRVVKLISDVETSAALNGKSMICDIPKDISGSFLPESRIEYCHGTLKESIQDLIIKKMQLFIVQNIGQVNQTSIKAI